MSKSPIPPVPGDHDNRVQRIPGKGYRIRGVPLTASFDPFRPGRFDHTVKNAPYGVSDGEGGILPSR